MPDGSAADPRPNLLLLAATRAEARRLDLTAEGYLAAIAAVVGQPADRNEMRSLEEATAARCRALQVLGLAKPPGKHDPVTRWILGSIAQVQAVERLHGEIQLLVGAQAGKSAWTRGLSKTRPAGRIFLCAPIDRE